MSGERRAAPRSPAAKAGAASRGAAAGAPTKPLELVPLGTGGYIPAGGRQTMSFLLLDGEQALVLDAGSGLARLLEPNLRERLASFARLDILLTHYHLDHVIGLSYLPGLWRDRPVRLYAPAPPLVKTIPEAALNQLISPPLFPVTMDRWPMPVEVIPYAGTELAIGGLGFRLRAQRHPGGSVGVRLGDAFAYTTDTVLDAATTEFVRGVDLLMHEVWLTDEEAAHEDAGKTGHSAAGPVADLAREAGVRRLWPIHHHPRRTDKELAALARSMSARAELPVEIAVEGQAYALRSG